MTSLIDHPPHYTSSPAACTECATPIECIQITEHMTFTLGNAIKYIWRADLKGNDLDDLRKAAWYIHREISKRERGQEAVSLPRGGPNGASGYTDPPTTDNPPRGTGLCMANAGVFCTLPRGHAGQHIATGTHGVIKVWGKP